MLHIYISALIKILRLQLLNNLKWTFIHSFKYFLETETSMDKESKKNAKQETKLQFQGK